jgi:hypothetical protein
MPLHHWHLSAQHVFGSCLSLQSMPPLVSELQDENTILQKPLMFSTPKETRNVHQRTLQSIMFFRALWLAV